MAQKTLTRRERLKQASNRRTTEVQDERVLALLRKGRSRKQVCARLSLTYHQVSLAVYRHESKSQKKSNL
jgi:hypothetical protein